jgi:SRSO17 transposase
LVEKAVEGSIPFKAVVADSFYGEDEGFKRSLSELGVGYVLALKPSHAWWHKIGEIGSPWKRRLRLAKLGRMSTIPAIG